MIKNWPDRNWPGKECLIFDFDGVIIDVTTSEDVAKVQPDAGRQQNLRRLHDAVEGRMAFLTARPIAFVDACMNGTPFPVIGDLGAEIRSAFGRQVEYSVPPLPFNTIPLMDIITRHGAQPVLKRSSLLALCEHLPEALKPDALRNLGAAFTEAAETLGRQFNIELAVEAGFESWQLVPKSTNKLSAAKALLASPRFMPSGCRPTGFGDSRQDEPFLRHIQECGGIAVWVHRGKRIEPEYLRPDVILEGSSEVHAAIARYNELHAAAARTFPECCM